MRHVIGGRGTAGLQQDYRCTNKHCTTPLFFLESIGRSRHTVATLSFVTRCSKLLVHNLSITLIIKIDLPRRRWSNWLSCLDSTLHIGLETIVVRTEPCRSECTDCVFLCVFALKIVRISVILVSNAFLGEREARVLLINCVA